MEKCFIYSKWCTFGNLYISRSPESAQQYRWMFNILEQNANTACVPHVKMFVVRGCHCEWCDVQCVVSDAPHHSIHFAVTQGPVSLIWPLVHYIHLPRLQPEDQEDGTGSVKVTYPSLCYQFSFISVHFLWFISSHFPLCFSVFFSVFVFLFFFLEVTIMWLY